METILCIDDDPVLLRSMSGYLSRLGYQVLSAQDGREGLETLNSGKIDLILTDLIMPETGGLEVLGEAISRFPEMPVIVISGTQAVKDAVEAMKLGAWDYISKPFESFAFLRHSVQKVLERARLLKENRRYREHLEVEVRKRTHELEEEIAGRKTLEEALRQSERRLQTIIENMPVMIHAHDEQGRYVFWNRECERVTGFSAEEMLFRDDVADILYPDREYKEAKDASWPLHENDYRDQESIIRAKNGNQRIILWSSLSGQCPVPGWYRWETGVDITDRKQAEGMVLTSLHEKEILLKEIHHRVKNNLQVISSLLSLQSGYIEDEAQREMFIQSQNRIKSMALVHEGLYQSADLSRIHFRSYVSSLVEYLSTIYDSSQQVRCSIDIDERHIPVNTAVPCGLILNELITNAFKHAFSQERTGTLGIGIRETTEDGVIQIAMSVRDNGPGLPEGFTLSQGETLGMLLITSLTSQIGGTVEAESNGGAVFTVTFPLPADSGSLVGV